MFFCFEAEVGVEEFKKQNENGLIAYNILHISAMATTVEGVPLDAETERAYIDALDDVHTRFVLNLPDEEFKSADRIFFQLEQAWWFYEDHICDQSPLPLPRFKGVKPFASKMFEISPLLEMNNFARMWNQFSIYKRKISTYGTILMNESCTKIALCRVYQGQTWTFPAGKINQNESGKDAAGKSIFLLYISYIQSKRISAIGTLKDLF